MNCQHATIEDSVAFFERFYPKITKDRIPVLGTLELTDRCNLRCLHCYVPADKKNSASSKEELTTQQWTDIIDQATAAGCLFLLITGGEPLLRPDFHAIYRHACRSGLRVTVFTNANLLSESILDLFEEYPPHAVEVSVYGATAATYENITGVKGSFARCMQGIGRLKDHGVRLKLKTVLLTVNMHELEDMESAALGLDAPFRFDPMVTPRLDRDPAPIQYRLSPAQAAEKEFASNERAQLYHDFFHRINSRGLSADLFQCGAGTTMFYINSSGMMRPCLMVSSMEQDLLRSTFMQVWESDIFRKLRSSEKAPEQCRTCDTKAVCGYCPGFFELENGDKRQPSEYLCSLGKERKQAIMEYSAGGH